MKIAHAVAIIFAFSPITHDLALWVHACAFLLIYHLMTRDSKALLFDALGNFYAAIWHLMANRRYRSP